MTFKKIKPTDEQEKRPVSLTVADLKRLFNALLLDVAGDGATGEAADAGKVALLERLENLIP